MLSRNLVLLVALASAATAVAWEHRSAQTQGRKLLQGTTAFCPDGCADGFCQQSGTPGGLKCVKCKGNLLADKASGFCACPKGKYSTGEFTCIDCPKGSFCIGGLFSLQTPPVNETCPQFMTTLGLRASSARSCVNLPGYSYDITAAGTPSATLCPLNTYGPGMKKQRACVPCPTGFTTNGKLGQTSANTCVVPAGYYLKGPGQAAPCPRGEWKAGVGPDGACTKCSAGVTTASEAAVSMSECKVVTKGYYASSFDTDGAVNGTTICPQGSYCPGGNQTAVISGRRLAQTSTGVVACPNGQWTMMPGASDPQQCLTPPGYYTDTVLGITAPCPADTFRADWLPEAPSCTACGVGVKADKNDRVTRYYPNGTEEEVAITSSSVDCYIQPGQALLFETLTKTWRAKNCTLNSYGVTNTTYGLTPAPCRDCPTGTVATRSLSTSAPYYVVNADGSGGFMDEMSCVTKPGFGMTGRGAQKCDQGFYNPGNNYETCKACGFGYTTTAAGAGLTVADCITDKGYGITNGKMGECPIGTYNDALGNNASTACAACPTGRTTPKAGSDSLSDCQLCSPGFGGLNCGSPCGGVGTNATYGPPGRAQVDGQVTECLACSANGQTATYSFSYDMQNQLFTPRTVSRIGAASPIECLSEYSQINDGSYYLPISATEDPSGNTVFKSTVASFEACIAECDKPTVQCQLLTYDYNNGDCFVRVPLAPKYEGAPWLALKILPAGYVGTSPWSQKENKVKALSSGMYAFYQEHLAEAVGIQKLPSDVVSGLDRNSFTSVKDCLTACDDAGDKCSGITVLSTVEPNAIGATCMFVTANTDPGVFKRTMIRADLGRLIFPSAFLCPSGYTSDINGITPCAPNTAPVTVLLFMRAAGSCSDSLIASVRTSLLRFLQSPTLAFGVYAPDVIINVGCVDVPTGQRRLLETPQADLYSTITYPGTSSGGQALVTAVNSNQLQIEGDVQVTVTGAAVQTVQLADLGDASIAVEQVPYVAGEPYYFTVTYKIGDTATEAAVVVTTSPAEAMYCWATDSGVGVTQFTCNPKKVLSAVQIIANGPNPKAVTTPVTASTAVYNTTCLKGSIAEGDVCVGCAFGTYAPANATTCTNCSDGFTTLRMNSFVNTQCDRCIPGRQGTGCTECPVGQVSPGGAASASLTCTACPAGQNTTSTGQSVCDLCAPGYAGASCSVCPFASWAAGDAAKGSQNCTACDAGYNTTATAKTSLDDCSVCSAGYGGDVVCDLCDFGFYAVGGSQANCTACPTGQTTPTNGSTSLAACSECLPGFGGPDCTQCLAGTWSAGGPRVSTVCTACATGVTTAANGSISADACTTVVAGRYAVTMVAPRVTATAVCQVGYYCPGGIPTAAFNATAFTPDGTISNCSAANTDIFVVGATSDAQCLCKAGYGDNDCTICAVGFYSAGNTKNNCTACAGNSTTPATGGTSAASCSVCLSGFGLPAPTCTICPAGQYSNGTTDCTPCPAGTANGVAGASSCTDCTTGLVATSAGSTQCLACGPGQIATNTTTCSYCEAGKEPVNNVCEPCGAGTYRVADADSTCIPCGYGKYAAAGVNVHASACSLCPAGGNTTNTTAGAATDCTVCAPGYEGDTCSTPCNPGYASLGGAGVLCTGCTAGTYSNTTAAATCTACDGSILNPVAQANDDTCLVAAA